jgi:hypothetical protein
LVLAIAVLPSITAGVPTCNIVLISVSADLFLNTGITKKFSKIIAVSSTESKDSGIENQHQISAAMVENALY